MNLIYKVHDYEGHSTLSFYKNEIFHIQYVFYNNKMLIYRNKKKFKEKYFSL